jgi:hypothetical protein
MSIDILARIKANVTGSNDFGGPDFAATIEKAMSLGSGTTANNADIVFFDVRTVASATNDDIDLAGSLSDAFGATITAAELVALMIINGPRTGAANTTALTVGGGSNPVVGFTSGTIGPILPGGIMLLAAGHGSGLGAVTAGTGDILRIANASGAAATYQIAVIARTA